MTTTPEQLQAWREKFHKAFPARALTEYDQAPTDNDYIFVGYLRAKQQTEQVMKLAKFGAMVLSAYKEGYVSDEEIGNFALSSRCSTKPIEAYEPNIEDTIKELLND